MADISVVIVSWNAREHLVKCLQSIEETKGDLSLEVLVVDNASSDGSPEAVVERFPGVELIRTGANLGFAKGNNVGIRKSSGRYLFLVNSDVIVLPGCFQKMIAFMDLQPGVGMLGPRVWNLDGSFQGSCRRLPSLWSSAGRALWLGKLVPIPGLFPGSHLSAKEHEEIREVEVLVGCFWMVRREALEQVGLLDEDFFMYGEDNDWCKRFAEAGWRLLHYPHADMIHAKGASSANDPVRFSVEIEKSRFLYWKKHRGSFGRFCYAGILFVGCLLRLALLGMLYVFRPSQRRETGLLMSRRFACIRWLLHI